MHHIEYHRSPLINDGGLQINGNTQINHHPTEGSLIGLSNDCFYSSDYWNIPYTNGLTPMKQIEGAICKIFVIKKKE